ncbi:MAG: 23S rRNA (uracil(1939)-C(5))-methyltransferase RlmD [Spirulinaceae cyanobacterium]
MTAEQWQQGNLLEVTIASLSDRGDGVGRWGERVVFVPQTVPGDRVSVRLLRVKPQYAQGKVHELFVPSPERIRPRCFVADKCGGCQWQQVSDAAQQQAKVQLVVDAIERIGGFTIAQGTAPAVPSTVIAPILTGPSSLRYRNKATYPLGRAAASKSANKAVQAGYYRQGTHQIVNLNQCPVQDERLDPLLAGVKQDIAQRGWSIYDATKHQGRLRHLALRIGRRTGEMLLTLVSQERDLQGLPAQAAAWQAQYPNLVGVCVNLNTQRGNVIFGDRTHCIAGRDYLYEEFAGLRLQLRPETFFQINTEAAETLLAKISQWLDLQGTETLLDAYCGIGTFTLPLARQLAQAIGVETQAAAIALAETNAQLNQIENATFHCAAVEDWLAQTTACPDIVLLDPPRKGCDRAVLEQLRRLAPPRIVYISCKPATLARDLKLLCASGQYQLTQVQPADFFPQTPHVECAAFLQHCAPNPTDHGGQPG